ncbi:MAG: glycosyltransferase [Actinobacteria bacterium]|nr:glycosyltransferase [Actinomycetota bacterium]
MFGTLFNAVMAVALVLLAWGFAQFVLWYRWGFEELREAERHAGQPNAGYRLVVLIACLDEEEVIGATVAAIRAGTPEATVIVVDDASEDRTAEVAAAAGATVLRRRLPEARQGKGPALNFAYRSLLAGLAGQGLTVNPDELIVCVMDADGRLSPGAIPAVLSRFNRPEVGGVQLPVRIRNRRTFLARMQDFEFWGMSAIAQMARIRTRSVSLGGNGQFTRLAALKSVGDAPWSDALTEDLDLGVELTLRGWDLDMAAAEWVSQQGVEKVRALVRQRTRWYQGHMRCAGKARLLWETPGIDRRTALETTLYLITPAFVMLPWSVAFTAGLVYFAYNLIVHRMMPFDGVGVHTYYYAVFWYMLTFLPPVVLGLLYARRTEEENVVSAVLKGHVQVFYAYLNMAAGWRALGRIVLGRNGWAKTARVVETPVAEAPPVPEPSEAAPLRRAA